MRAQGRTERGVCGEPGRVGRGEVQLHEASPLLLGDVQAAMDVDEVPKAQRRGERVWPAERFDLEGGETVDVVGPPGTEERLQDRVGQHARVEDVDEPAQRCLPTGMLEYRFHNYIITSMSARAKSPA